MAKTFKIKIKDFQEAIATNSEVQGILQKVAEEKINNAREKLVNELQEHPVSREIDGGPDSSNISGTLNGYGNLFSFIGFQEGKKPVAEFIQTLYKYIRLRESSVQTKIQGNRIELQYQAIVPVDREIEGRTKMPWESGRSWLFAIERGISGFSQYLNKKFEDSSVSRSTGGIQVKGKVHPGTVYKRISYWTKMYNQLIKNVRK